MTHEKIRILLAALPFVGAIACAESAPSTPPQTPADQTMTTGGTTAPAAPASPTVGPASPASGDSSAASNPGSNAYPSGLRSSLDATAGTSPTGAPSGDVETLNDGKIVAIVQTADRGEIEQARDALQKAKNGRVKQFAQHMVTDHSAAEAKLSSLDSSTGITPQESAVTAQLKSGGEQIMGNLRSASGSDFDKAYIDAQVSEHTQVLDLLDNKLIPQAQNVDLTKTLQAVRAKVAGHLKMAQDIQTSLAQAK